MADGKDQLAGRGYPLSRFRALARLAQPFSTLSACFGCRAWRGPAQRVLFSDIVIKCLWRHRIGVECIVSPAEVNRARNWNTYRLVRPYLPLRVVMRGPLSRERQPGHVGENSRELYWCEGVRDMVVTGAGIWSCSTSLDSFTVRSEPCYP